jgi:HEAT repeat protein
MPSDDELAEEVISRYDEARRVLARDKDPRAIRLLLNSFGSGDGFGVYQLVEDTLREYPRDEVIEGLADSLRSPIPSVRSWSMEISLEYPDTRLIPAVIEQLNSADPDARLFAAHYLVNLGRQDAGIREALRAALTKESDAEIRFVIQTGIANGT